MVIVGEVIEIPKKLYTINVMNISEFSDNHFIISITILFLVSYNKYTTFVISKFFQDIALKF